MATPRKSAARTASPAAIKAAAAAAPVAELPPQVPNAFVATPPVVPGAVESAAADFIAATATEGSAEVLDAAFEQISAAREALRQSSESSFESSRVAYDRMKKAAEEATGAVGAAYEAAQKGFAEINAKAMAALKSNADASFEFACALSSAKSLADILALQGEHARKSFEALNAQTKEIASLAQKVAADAAGPIATRLKGFDGPA
jgi:phasin